jgi:hypothetical protein
MQIGSLSILFPLTQLREFNFKTRLWEYRSNLHCLLIVN